MACFNKYVASLWGPLVELVVYKTLFFIHYCFSSLAMVFYAKLKSLRRKQKNV